MRFPEDPSWKHARYHCPVCSRPFDRKDTLSRHMQIHDKRRPQLKTRRKACLSCSQSKTRCNGERPACSACQKRNQTCVYEDPRSNPPRQSTSSDAASNAENRLFSQPSIEGSASRDEPQLDLLSPLGE